MASDVEILDLESFVKNGITDRDVGVIVLGNAKYSFSEESTDFRTEHYDIPILYILCDTSAAAFIDTLIELDRSCDDYTDGGGARQYTVNDLEIPNGDQKEYFGDGATIKAAYRLVSK